jgi:hypothetical protein
MNEETFLFDSKKEGFAKVILAIIRYVKVNQNLSQEFYNKEINRKLKLPKDNSDRLLRSCIDLIEDTENAIQEFYNKGLGKELGEQYLRLYGLLNAVNLQRDAITRIAKFYAHKEVAGYIKNFQQNKLIQIRHMLGAHTTSFKSIEYQAFVPGHEPDKDNFFLLSQSSLNSTGNGILIVDGYQNSFKINLPELLLEYTLLSTDLLEAITSKAVNAVFVKESKSAVELNEAVQIINKMNQIDYKELLRTADAKRDMLRVKNEQHALRFNFNINLG